MYAHRTAKLPVPVHIPQGNSHKVTAVIKLKRPLFYLYGGAAAVLALLLLIRGDAAAQGVRDGIDLCVTSVIPALFPFFAASQLLVSLGAAEALGRAAGPLFRRLFGMDGAGAAAYLLGLIGGYPLGAKTAESLVRQELLTPEDGALLLTFWASPEAGCSGAPVRGYGCISSTPLRLRPQASFFASSGSTSGSRIFPDFSGFPLHHAISPQRRPKSGLL